MANYKEIVTKAIIGKGKKSFTTTHSVIPQTEPSTILGCWVINHKFNGTRENNEVTVNGSYDVNIWYSCLSDTKTEVLTQTNTYVEKIAMTRNDDETDSNEEIIVRSTKQPSCIKAEIENGKVNYVIEKELGAELVGDAKIRIAVNDAEAEDEENLADEDVSGEIDNEVNEDFIEE